MSKSRRADTAIGDYAAIVGINTTQGKPVIVGGQAANVWANFYFPRIGARLSRFRPFTSKDLDLAGDRSLLEQIRDVTGGSIHYSGPRTPVIGYVETLIGETSRKIEVLRDVKGLQRWELADAVDVIVDDFPVRVLAPIKVLKAKICNSVSPDQEDRNDVNHVGIMIECVREFLRDILAEVSAERVSQRDAVNLLEELREIVRSPEATKAATIWGLDFTSVWPINDLVKSGMQKIQRFVQHRLNPMW